jgi:pseudouridine-5'-phosphate glycosidase
MNIFKKIRFLNLTKRIQLTRSVHILEKNKFLSISEEIKQSDKPVVALESTIITHGLPYPLNLETALQVENVVRELNV